MSFQSTVFIPQGFGVPGEIFQDVPWTVLSWTLNSSGTPNIVGATAYTVTSQGFAQAGSGGAYGFAGILSIPKDYALAIPGGSPLEPTLEIADFSQAELVTQGMLVVTLPSSANIGDYIIYNDTTGELSSIAPSDIIPSGYSSAYATVSQFTKTASGSGQAVILITYASAATSSGGGGNWPYVDTLWTAGNGFDTNSGESINLPKLTPAGVQAALVANVTNVWNIEDSGSYDIASAFLAPCPLVINAPGATFTWSGVGGGAVMFNQNTSTTNPLSMFADEINATGSLVVFQGASPVYTSGPGGYLQITNATTIFEDSGVTPTVHTCLNVNTDTNGGAFSFRNGSRQVINALNLGRSAVTSTTPSGAGTEITEIKAHFFDGSVRGNADYFMLIARLGGDFETITAGITNMFVGKSDSDATTLGAYNGLIAYSPTTVSPLMQNNVFGNNVSMNYNSVLQNVYATAYTVPASGVWSYNPGAQNCSMAIVINGNAGNGTITPPQASTLPEGWNMKVVQTSASGAEFIAMSGDTISGQNSVGPGATSCYTGIGICEFVRGPANGTGGFIWVVDNFFTTN
jgi:hypothetical protein